MDETPTPSEQVKLRKLSEKIERLMKENDVTGIINLQGKEFGEYRIVVESSWSVLKWKERPEGTEVRFTCNFKTGSPEEKERGRLTIGMIHGMMHIASVQLEQLGKVSAMLDQHIKSHTTIGPRIP